MNLSVKNITAATAGAVLVLILVWYLALFRPQSHQLSVAHQNRAAAEQQITSLQTQTASLRALLKQVPADTSRLASLDQAMPSTPDLKDVLDQLHALATASGVQVTSVGPSAPAVTTGAHSGAAGTSGPTSLSMTMTASGPYPGVANFISGLAHLKRTLVVDNLSVSPGAGGAIAANLTTRIFYAS
ncbi:MAG TPA: type 4a pilus biogenesis protein PilO [Acidimicrobiales bacterium]|nr:type 4a pilus biogenesis protein PilO [Acidimicrobiales bacterium]